MYSVGSGKEKTGYISESCILISAGYTVTDEVMTDGYRYATQSLNVNSRGLESAAVSYGSVGYTEGVTLLYDYNVNTGSESYQVGFIEYITSGGMKRGYVRNASLSSPFVSKLIKASAKTTTYTGPDSQMFNLETGAIGVNEYVCAIGYTGNYIFIEYNAKTTDTFGRKRAFCLTSDLGISNPSSLGITELPSMQKTQGYISSAHQNVSGAPGEANILGAYIGAIGQYENVYAQSPSGNTPYNQFGYTYIVYHVGGNYKGGLVPNATLTIAKNPSIPDVPSNIIGNGGFEQAFYWQTGLGGPINAYKIGDGNKRLYLVYAQHGFEDEGCGDGVELTRIAIDFMNYVYQNKDGNFTNILKDWTIYVVPYVNRDGITSGKDENGPGRTTIVGGIDLNRDWPTNNFTPKIDINADGTTGRYNSGPIALGAIEAQGLEDVLLSDKAKPVSGYTSILIDIHGWDCEALTYENNSEDIGSIYVTHFQNDANTSFTSHNQNLPHSFGQRNMDLTGASGYLSLWAIENGIDKSILLELPSHTKRNDGGISLSTRFINATVQLLNTK